MRAFDEAANIPLRSDDANDEVDDASRDSFPASDPPGWTGLRIGSPPATPPKGAVQNEATTLD